MGSVTGLIEGLKGGSEDAFRLLFGRFFGPLTRQASRRLRGSYARLADGEDVALSALNGLVRAVENGEPLAVGLTDRHSLQQFLCILLGQKLRRLRRDGTRSKRDCRRVLAESPSRESPSAAGLLPDEEALGHITVNELLALLDPDQQTIVQLKVMGGTNLEVAGHLGCSQRRVERELSAIRSVWRKGYRELTGREPPG